MVFSSYEELMAVVEERRKERLTLEVDLGSKYSPEYETAKAELAQAKAMKMAMGGGFLGDSIGPLEARVAELKPEARAVWVQYEKLDLNEWASLLKNTGNQTSVEQYERVLPKVFKGVFGQDPVKPEDWNDTHPDEVWEAPEPLTTDPLSVSSKGGAKSILPGGALNSVIQNFMAWQNSGGDVTIRPTKSGRV